MPKSVSNLDAEATENTNTAGVMTPILTFEPEEGTYWTLNNRVPMGAASGIPLIMDLRDSADNPLPTDTVLLLRNEKPGDSEPTAVTVEQSNISSWNNLSIKEQLNEENIDAVKVELKANKVNVTHRDELTVEVNSSAVIDWANSEFYIPREAVDEFPTNT